MRSQLSRTQAIMKFQSPLKLFVTIGFATAVALATASCGDKSEAEAGRGRLVAFVSIVPQKTFVQAIAKDNVDVHVMIRPGFSPATYDPTPQQLLKLARADLYFRVGVPFEDAWMSRIREAAPAMKVIDTRKGIQLLEMLGHGHDHDHGHETGTTIHDHEHEHGHNHELTGSDPHIWLDPVRVKKQVETIADALKAVDPQRAAAYDANRQRFQQKLDDLDQDIASRIQKSGIRKFMIFHPSLGYFADRYGLKQMAIEVEGKSPGASDLGKIIEHARSEGVRTVFVQKEFSAHAAEKIAEAIDGQVVVLDPLAADYFANLRRIADAIAAQNQRQ